LEQIIDTLYFRESMCVTEYNRMGKDNRFLRDQRHVANDYEFLWESLRDGIAQKVYKGD
jgi:hypothetical protein